MRTLITGHRLFKLESYDIEWIKLALEVVVKEFPVSYGLSGMASGVDLWYCEILNFKNLGYTACIPFEEQALEMSGEESEERYKHIENANCVKYIRNSAMLELSQAGIAVWDGNKGGTHNVVQQMVEKDLPWTWINPAGKKVWRMEKSNYTVI